MDLSPETCVFCRINADDADASIVYRDDDSIAFMDTSPINPGHTLVCPSRHVVSFTDLQDAEASALISLARRIAATLKAGLNRCEGVNVLLADGEAAGQEVAHVHLHVVPRFTSDGFGWKRLGTQSSRNELDEIAEQLRLRLD